MNHPGLYLTSIRVEIRVQRTDEAKINKRQKEQIGELVFNLSMERIYFQNKALKTRHMLMVMKMTHFWYVPFVQ